MNIELIKTLQEIEKILLVPDHWEIGVNKRYYYTMKSGTYQVLHLVFGAIGQNDLADRLLRFAEINTNEDVSNLINLTLKNCVKLGNN